MAVMTNLPTLRVLAAVLCIDLDDPDDAEDLEAAGLLLGRRVLRELDGAGEAIDDGTLGEIERAMGTGERGLTGSGEGDARYDAS